MEPARNLNDDGREYPEMPPPQGGSPGRIPPQGPKSGDEQSAEVGENAADPDFEADATSKDTYAPGPVGDSLRDLARQTVTTGGVVGKEGLRVARSALQSIRRAAEAKIAEGLEKLSVTPEEKRGLARKLLEVIPFVGPNTKYATAWRKWHEGFRSGDEEKQEQARKECLVALADLGVDIALLSSAKYITGAAKAVRSLVGPAYLARTARVMGARTVDPVDAVAAEVVKSPRARKLAELLLTLVQPGETAFTPVSSELANQVTEVVTEQDEKTKSPAGSGEANVCEDDQLGSGV